MNWSGGGFFPHGFIPIILYGNGATASNQSDVITTESGINITTEDGVDLMSEGIP